jgi:molybdenum cofactor biosynthesis protein B
MADTSSQPASESTAGHRAKAESTDVACAVVTISDSRTPETDESGRLMRTRLESNGVEVAEYAIVPDEPDRIDTLIEELAGSVDAVLMNGGTGISKRDRTFDVLSAKLERTLPGFGEIFRMLSYEEVGAAAMLSRATAGLYRETLFFSTPGSPNAVEVAMDKLILPELKHLVWEVVRE